MEWVEQGATRRFTAEGDPMEVLRERLASVRPVELPGVDHHDSHELGGERYFGALRRFVERVVPVRP